MMYKAKFSVCSEDLYKKNSKQSEHPVELLNVKPWLYVKEPPGFRKVK
jgi:hypothetical protein